MIGKPIFWQVPNDPKAVIGARVAGQPLVKHAPKSRVQQSIQGLAQALYGKPVGRSRSPREQGRVGILRQAMKRLTARPRIAVRRTRNEADNAPGIEPCAGFNKASRSSTA